MSWKIPLFKIYWDEDDLKTVSETIRSGMNWAVGPNVEAFERGLGTYIGTRYCATFNSGTSALHATLLAQGIGPGDEVIVPSFTFIATANAPLFLGARPVFADIEVDTYGLDPEDVVEKITDKTKAIVPIHYGGGPCRIKELRELADDHNLLLIEDAAEAFGAEVGGRRVGTFGNSAMLSFCQNKVITTGEGGAVLTDSRDVYERLKLIRSHGRQETTDYFSSNDFMDYISLGFNYRMSNITAALGVSQLRKAGKIIEMRRKKAEYLTGRLKPVKDLVLPGCPKDSFHVFQMYTIRSKHRNDLMDHLAKRGIMAKVYFYPVHLTTFYKNTLGYEDSLRVTEKLSEEVLTLPLYPEISEGELDMVVRGITDFFEGR